MVGGQALADFGNTLHWLSTEADAVGITVHLRYSSKNPFSSLSDEQSWLTGHAPLVRSLPTTALMSYRSESLPPSSNAAIVAVAAPQVDAFDMLFGENGVVAYPSVSPDVASVQAIVAAVCKAARCLTTEYVPCFRGRVWCCPQLSLLVLKG